MTDIQKHFVTFYSPGTLVAEDTTKPIASWDVNIARKMAKKITERYGAVPYSFQFSTRSRSDTDLDSSVIATSPTYFINCKVRTLEEVEADNDPKESILLSNMRGNGFKAIVQTVKGWKWTQPLRDGDVVLM